MSNQETEQREMAIAKIDSIIEELKYYSEHEVRAHFYENYRSFPLKMFRDSLIAIKILLTNGGGR